MAIRVFYAFDGFAGAALRGHSVHAGRTLLALRPGRRCSQLQEVGIRRRRRYAFLRAIHGSNWRAGALLDALGERASRACCWDLAATECSSGLSASR
jgi:hypothetical protein